MLRTAACAGQPYDLFRQRVFLLHREIGFAGSEARLLQVNVGLAGREISNVLSIVRYQSTGVFGVLQWLRSEAERGGRDIRKSNLSDRRGTGGACGHRVFHANEPKQQR